MTKKKFFNKTTVVMAALILSLGGAVWLNMEYSGGAGGFVNAPQTSSSKNLGDTQYVINEITDESAQTSANQSDYFVAARTEKEKTRNDAIKILEETVKDVTKDEKTKNEAADNIAKIALRMEKETLIETVIKAKGFSDAVVIIGDDNVNVVVKAEELLQSQVLQIQDAVTAETKISLEKIKIVNVK